MNLMTNSISRFVAATVTLIGLGGLVPGIAQAGNNFYSPFELSLQQSNPVNASEILKVSEIYAQNNSEAQSHVERGDSLLSEENFQGALTEYNRAIEIDPEYTEAYIARAIVHLQADDSSAAIADLEKASSLFQAQGRTEDYEDIQSFLETLR